MFAICCAIAPTAELKDRILELCDDYGGNTGTMLVFIDDLSRVYDEDDGLGYNKDSISAPFAGKTAYECWLMLKRILAENEGSYFADDMFAILDQRSLEDNTLLLVEEPEEEDGGEAHSVRAVFQMCETQMALWTAGKTTVTEAKERAQTTEDGVLQADIFLCSCDISADAVDADLRIASERYRSRVAQLNRNNLATLIEGQLVSPDSTDREEVELVLDEEWYIYDCMSLYETIKMPKDLYVTPSDGTNPPLPEERRTQLVAQLEEELQDRVPSKFRPLRLPDDFKQLCALTNALEGPGLPGINHGYVPHALDGLDAVCENLKNHSADQMIKEPCLNYLNSKVGVGIWMGATHKQLNGRLVLRWVIEMILWY
ncbi:hypothetical protein KCV03_g6354, partial [Aureobasidium melanogenum]